MLCRYSVTMPENLTDEEKEGFKSGVLIPVRLRYQHFLLICASIKFPFTPQSNTSNEIMAEQIIH